MEQVKKKSLSTRLLCRQSSKDISTVNLLLTTMAALCHSEGKKKNMVMGIAVVVFGDEMWQNRCYLDVSPVLLVQA